ncbi:PhoX family protein [Corynebacterium sanguinis]|uniref:PhoX family phosphatase n=1 Tax=Corynebacterium sanguinis TaxID=2594913 RepID=A0A838WWF7_9CORY|nr:PhoX family phosphatase [Corynebacterium sanguinis]MBA4505113.1 PhoX family phosphatase [Corynebacterium sanguinis]MCT1412088.1 PhoX family phosphatase [Corynebacterium sanguinis]MCT1445176.1 PhoX family phosphatase [Corynebacterium sanguinis]MCT1498550.1 PhoX family phosphatase [Corynebacterium sanguinis]MCT2288162.1 PhoX family phosphatase [Corynebacterium sanguinis]
MTIKGLNLLFQSKRSKLTCTYKCGNACWGECTNTSDNAYFGDLVSRRGVLKSFGLGVVTVGGGAALAACSSEPGSGAAGTTTASAATGSSSAAATEVKALKGMQFEPVVPNTEDKVVVPTGYATSVLIAWGDPIFKDAPEFDPENQTAADAEKQFGFNNDFAGLMDHPDDDSRMVYVCSHEYTTEPQMFPGYDADNPTDEQINIGLANHGHTILEVSKVGDTGELKREFGPLNRRITANTPFELRGILAGADLVKTSADPEGKTVLGTLNNCAGGMTPWGTFLSGEENIDQYFANGAAVTGERPAADVKRFGVDDEASERKWERLHDRFDLAKEPNEFNRFGYIVEINPLDPNSTPIKHTSMGRFKHEAGNVHVDKDGTVVCYSGDDSRFEYIYKFVSSKKMVEGDVEHNMGILDEGTLYVAKLEGDSPQSEITGDGDLPSDGEFDGKGTWVKLLTVTENGAESHVDGFTPEEVAVYTRLAADEVGATKMDRPEDFEVNPVNEKVYVALTNNSYRGATGENASKSKEDVMEYAPIRENKNGLVMEIEDDFAGENFTWNLLLVCGDPAAASTYFGGFDKDKVSPISCPDNLAFDTYGNLWISTDGNALGSNDGLYAVGLEGENRGQVKCFLTVPKDAETCGPIVTEERVMVNVQHPGESDDATYENPTSNWPEGGNSVPRPAVAVAWREDGKEIGVEA